MRVEEGYKKDASAGKFKKFCVEADIKITADHLNDEKELIEICRRVRDAIDEEVTELEEDLMKEGEEEEEEEEVTREKEEEVAASD